MKYIFSYVLILLYETNCKLNNIFTYGIYHSNKVDDYWYYLRYLNDSTILSVSSSGKPNGIKTWFIKNPELVSIGKNEI